MLEQISYKTIPLALGVLVMTLLISAIVLAWTEPSTAPPGGNVDAPINIGSDEQTKIGDLIVGK